METNPSKTNTPMRYAAIIVGGGQGIRLGAQQPKAFVPLDGKELFLHSVETMVQHQDISKIIIVVPEEYFSHTQNLVCSCGYKKPISITTGGQQRWESVRNGVFMADDCHYVLIHDAARPFIDQQVITSLIEKSQHFPCVIAASPVVDTMREFISDRCGKTLDRSTMLRVATPQLFYREDLLKAFQHASALNPPPTDEAMLMQSMGHAVGFVFCTSFNFKITTHEDLVLANALCQWKKTTQNPV